MATHVVVSQPQIFCRIDVGHARHDDAASVDAQVLIVGDVHFFIFGVEDSHQRGELFFGGAGETPVSERIVGILLEQIPGNRTARIDEVGFQVGVFSHFFIIEGRRGKHVEILQTTALKQFSHGALQCDTEVRVRAEGGEAGAVSWVEQHNADHWIFSTQRTIVSKDWETFCFQFGDRLYDARITCQHLGWNLRQADALGDNTVFHVTFEHL
ncbi:Uncharacterised protein [Kluyvera cryocrescens]|nr:Uncharacterised protein [Kluyvera cryocrescens]